MKMLIKHYLPIRKYILIKVNSELHGKKVQDENMEWRTNIVANACMIRIRYTAEKKRHLDELLNDKHLAMNIHATDQRWNYNKQHINPRKNSVLKFYFYYSIDIGKCIYI